MSRIEPTVEEDGEAEEVIPEPAGGKNGNGEMKKDFKFPVARPTTPTPAEEDSAAQAQGRRPAPPGLDYSSPPKPVITPSSIEVPPPPPVDKERSLSSVEDVEDEVGPTVDIPL